MTLDEAITAFEKDFAEVSDAVGVARHEASGLDVSKSPGGATYRVVTSGGATTASVWFVDEEQAAKEWLRHAWDFQDKHGKGRLCWRERPAFLAAEFFGMDQAAMIQDARLRGALTIRIGFVYSRMAIEKVEATTGKVEA